MKKLLATLMFMAFALFATMSPAYAVFDSLALLRASSAGNLTATANTTGLDLGSVGGWLHGQAVIRISVPQATGTSPTLDVIIQDSDDNSTWKNVLTFDQITASGNYRRHFQTVRRYVRAAMTVAGTTPNFGAVVIGIDSGDQFKGTQAQ